MAVEFIRRTTAPSNSNLWYLKTTKGGYNKCIQIRSNGSVLPNCTGYARRMVDLWSVKLLHLVTYQEEMLKIGILEVMDIKEDKLQN